VYILRHKMAGHRHIAVNIFDTTFHSVGQWFFTLKSKLWQPRLSRARNMQPEKILPLSEILNDIKLPDVANLILHCSVLL
ncbi:MAG: hypothetical protein K2L77_02905, partial [Muribaculaceae bacterium]|nr:hypothetical protein [Muribaculaceae bacterium]